MDAISPINENTWIAYLGDIISDDVAMKVKHFNALLKLNHADVVIDTVPSYTSVLVTFDLQRVDRFGMSKIMRDAFAKTMAAEHVDEALETVTIPVCYDIGDTNDIDYVAEYCNMSKQQVIDTHAGETYRVYSIGFSPGFGFLGNTAKHLYVPRKTTPRLKVPAGSVALADNQTAVYPSESPGGWQVIGRTWTKMVDWEADELSYLKIGYKVQFEPISAEEYKEKGGTA